MKTTALRGALGVSLLFASSISLLAAFPGAIYTSLGDGTTVNQNTYASKPDVYLNGGPQNAQSAGLPNGYYYYQVTSPNGALLSQDNAECRVLQVVDGRVYGTGKANADFPGNVGCSHADGSLNPVNGSIPVQLIPFADTPNSGGEYKVWLIAYNAAVISGDLKVLNFPNNQAKTDNFKVLNSSSCTGEECPPPPPVTVDISGQKYYDANGNGTKDGQEVGIENWGINVYRNGALYLSDVTDNLGNFSFTVDAGVTYVVCEVQQAGYTQSEPSGGPGDPVSGEGHCYSITPTQNTGGLVFGNYIRISGEKWFDTNKDGVKQATENYIAGIKILIAVCSSADCLGNLSYVTTYTDANGQWSQILPSPASYYKVCEMLPPAGQGFGWSQTWPVANKGCYIGEVGVSDADSIDFGNVCTLNGAGTIGFWSNKNGQKIITDKNLLGGVNALNLQDGTGALIPDFANVGAYNTWLLGAKATYMGYMLSAQMSATWLNVASGKIPDASVYFPYTDSFASINSLINHANGSLLNTAGGCNEPNRAECEAYKDIFDTINNNKAVISGCPVVYP